MQSYYHFRKAKIVAVIVFFKDDNIPSYVLFKSNINNTIRLLLLNTLHNVICYKYNESVRIGLSLDFRKCTDWSKL